MTYDVSPPAPAPAGMAVSALWLVVAFLLGFALSELRPAGSPVIYEPGVGAVQDWHGNVRRSGE